MDFAVNDGHVSPTGRDKDGYSFTNGARMGFEQLVGGGQVAAWEGGHGCRSGSLERWAWLQEWRLGRVGMAATGPVCLTML